MPGWFDPRRGRARPNRTRFGRLLLVSPLLATASCLVSFDGYDLYDADASFGGDAGRAGASGGSGDAGRAGEAGRAGAGGGADAGEDGSAGSSGAAANGGGAGAGGASGSAGIGGKGGSAGGAGSAGRGGTSGSAGTGGTAGAGGTGGTTTCPVGLPGPPLLEIPKPDGGIYCIDRSEVTNAQYKVFLDAPKTGLVVPAACSGNASYAPATSATCGNTHFEPVNEPTHPVTCVDWCDAAAYCKWAGKRLCGAVAGGAVAPSDFANPARSQWHNACSRGGARKFPYGNTYAGGYCNGLDYMSSVRAIPVVSAALCQGGYDGLYDMSGNVREWEDGCDSSGNCLQRGGGYLDYDSGSVTLRCHSGSDTVAVPSPPTAPRFQTSSQRGFRCCLDG